MTFFGVIKVCIWNIMRHFSENCFLCQFYTNVTPSPLSILFYIFIDFGTLLNTRVLRHTHTKLIQNVYKVHRRKRSNAIAWNKSKFRTWVQKPMRIWVRHKMEREKKLLIGNMRKSSNTSSNFGWVFKDYEKSVKLFKKRESAFTCGYLLRRSSKNRLCVRLYHRSTNPDMTAAVHISTYGLMVAMRSWWFFL